MDPEEQMAALARHSGRRAGSDAERRAARHLEERLRALGRAAELEPFVVSPRPALAHAMHALLAIAGSLASVANPPLGLALVLAAAVLTVLDLAGILPLAERLTGRRASQNVTSPESRDKPGVIVVVAGYDARGPRAGGLAWLTRRTGDPWALMLGSMVLLLALCGLRAAGLEGTAISAAQFVPTVVLVGLAAVLVEGELGRPPSPADGGGAAAITALGLAERLGGRLAHFDLWVALTGGGAPSPRGMAAWLRRHRKELRTVRAVVVGLRSAPAGDLWFARRHGAPVPLPAHPELLRICREVAEDGGGAGEGIVREPVEAAVASAGGIPAITVTGADGSPAGEALERWLLFCRELIERVDAELGPRVARS